MALSFEVFIFGVRVTLDDVVHFHGPSPTLIDFLTLKDYSVEIDFALFVFGADKLLDEVVVLEIFHGLLAEVLLVQDTCNRFFVILILSLSLNWLESALEFVAERPLYVE